MTLVPFPAPPPLEANRNLLRAQRAAPPALQRSMSGDAAFAAIVDGCAEMVARNAVLALSEDDPSGPHQLRVGIRRLRVALTVHRPWIDAPGAKALSREAGRLARCVGPWRDADVLIEEIARPALGAVAPHHATRLMGRLESFRDHSRRAARRDLVAADLGGFLWRLGRWRGGFAWRADKRRDRALFERKVRRLAPRALDRAWARVDCWGARVEALDMVERHEMRKALKLMRYAADFYAPLFPAETTSDYLMALKRTQTAFGRLNDLTLLDRLENAAPDAVLRPSLQAIAQARGADLEPIWVKCLSRWRVLDASEPFWAAA